MRVGRSATEAAAPSSHSGRVDHGVDELHVKGICTVEALELQAAQVFAQDSQVLIGGDLIEGDLDLAVEAGFFS